MTLRTPTLESRLPAVGTTIFTVMSALAQEHGAVNLGQGFPDFDCDPALISAVDDAMRRGLNQYPPMTGVPALREAVAAKMESLYGHRYDPGTEITITAGATQAILTAILAIVHPGDEVIVLDPCYDSYEPNITLAGGDGDFGAGVIAVPVEAFHLGGHRFAQDGHARHRRVLVEPAPHRVVHRGDQGRVAIEIREALPEVDGAMLLRQGRHDGEDGGADGRQPAFEGGGARGHS